MPENTRKQIQKVLSRDVAYASLSREESAILHLKQHKLYMLNATGRLIVDGVSDGLSNHEIANAVVDTFKVSYDDAVCDVNNFLKELTEASLVK